MRRSSQLLSLAAITAALILPLNTVAAAATTVTYKVAGVEYATTTFPASSSFAGVAESTPSRTESGVWNAVFEHDLGGIVGGTFKFRSKRHSLTDSISTGTFSVNPGGTCAKTTIAVHGELGEGGSFDVTVTRYGYSRAGHDCVMYLATVRGTAILVFP